MDALQASARAERLAADPNDIIPYPSDFVGVVRSNPWLPAIRHASPTVMALTHELSHERPRPHVRYPISALGACRALQLCHQRRVRYPLNTLVSIHLVLSNYSVSGSVLRSVESRAYARRTQGSSRSTRSAHDQTVTYPTLRSTKRTMWSVNALWAAVCHRCAIGRLGGKEVCSVGAERRGQPLASGVHYVK